jgi:hypothetical protein
MSASESQTTLQPNTPVPVEGTTPTNSKVPLLGEGFQESTSKPVSRSANTSDTESDVAEPEKDGVKSGKRRLFGFGRKHHDDKDKNKNKKKGELSPDLNAGTIAIEQPTARRVPAQNSSPPRSNPNHPYQLPASPQRNLYSSSPRMVSPAGSQIFERDVQESTLPVPNSPAIPSHIQTENHIPPVLDASSEAITNKKLDPDSVEIVMHSSHQPAAVTVTGISALDPIAGTWADDLVAHPDKDDAASNYGALDSTDVRRLSFISFSDIVQSEHAEHAGNRDSIYLAGLSSLSSRGAQNRSPSPVRSPVSSAGFGTSPPTSKSASVKGFDTSPRAKPLGSPISTHTTLNGGELTIETMTQALRRTGSGDLSGVRSQPMSPTSPDGLSDKSFSLRGATAS